MKRFFMKLGLQKAFLIVLAMSFAGNILPMAPASSVVGASQGTVPQAVQPATTAVVTPVIVAPVQPATQLAVPPATVALQTPTVQTPATVSTPASIQTTATPTPAAIATTPAPLQPAPQSVVVPSAVTPAAVAPQSTSVVQASATVPTPAQPQITATTATSAATSVQLQPASQPSAITAVVSPPATSIQASTTTPVASTIPSQPLAQIGVAISQAQPAVVSQPVATAQDQQAEEQAQQAMVRGVRYGDRIILKHAKTGMRLASRLGYNFNHKGSSGQQMVSCNGDKMNMSHYWLVKGPHGTARDYKFGQMVQSGDVIRFEHYSSSRNLHSDTTAKAPSGKNQEVYCFTKNQGDENCNWLLQGNLSIDTPVSLKHQKTGAALRCDATPLVQDKKSIEVSAAATADDGINWVVERSVATPTVYSGALEVVFGRGGNLSSADARYIKDTTNLLRAQVKGNRLKLPIAGQKSSLDSIGLARESSDDKRGLLFVYKLSGELFVSLSNEFDPIAVPNNNKAIALIKSGQGLGTGFRLLRALYGDLNKITGDRPAQVYDVTKRVQGLSSGGKIEFAEGSKSVTFGFDPAKGKTKALLIFYKFGRKIYVRMIADLDKATIDSAAPEKDAQLVVDLDAAPVAVSAVVAPVAGTGVVAQPQVVAQQKATDIRGRRQKRRAIAKQKLTKPVPTVKGAVKAAVQTAKQQLPGVTPVPVPAPVAQTAAPVAQLAQQPQIATQTVTSPGALPAIAPAVQAPAPALQPSQQPQLATQAATTPVATTSAVTAPVATAPAIAAAPVAAPQGGAPKVDPLPTLAV